MSNPKPDPDAPQGTSPSSHEQTATTTSTHESSDVDQPKDQSRAEVKIGQPKAFDGDRLKTIAFMQTCLNYLFVNKHIYNTDTRMIGFILSYMTEGNAALWASNFIREKLVDGDYGSFVDFTTKIGKDFSPLSTTTEGIRRLKNLRMGKDAFEYIAEFRNLVGLSGIEQFEIKAQFFLDGLIPRVRQELASKQSQMKTMEDFYTLALELDADWKNSRPKINFRNNRAISADEPGREEVRVAKLSDAERQKLMEENKCFRCKKVGHQARNCRSRPAPPTRAARHGCGRSHSR